MLLLPRTFDAMTSTAGLWVAGMTVYPQQSIPRLWAVANPSFRDCGVRCSRCAAGLAHILAQFYASTALQRSIVDNLAACMLLFL